ncbi:MAG: V-type ATP synthase subunit E [Candidatus Hydrothermarchaeales archaeon]
MVEGLIEKPSPTQVQKIVDRILDDARRKAQEIEDDAKEEENAILAEAREKANKVKNEILSKAEKDAKFEKERIIADARVKARRSILEAREEMIEMAFSKAIDGIERITTLPEYSKSLKNLILESVSMIGDREVELLLNERDKGLLDGQEFKELRKVKISNECLPNIGGVIARTTDGAIEVDNTVEARLERQKAALRKKVAEILFMGEK